MAPETARSIVKGRLRDAFAGTDAVTVTGCPGAGARGAANGRLRAERPRRPMRATY